MNIYEQDNWVFGAIMFIVRYLSIASIVYFVFYKWKKKYFFKNKIQTSFPNIKQIQIELLYSISTMIIYSFSALILLFLYRNHFTKMYMNISEFGVLYFLLSVFIMLFLHDTFFYWSHRFMHSSKWLYRFHKIHHLSTNPTPWTAFSFHPIEAIISLGIIPIIVVFIPTHPFALALFLSIMTFYNIFVHLGFEIFNSKFSKNKFGKWINSTSNHDLHHEIGGKINLSFYFTFWDRIMRTYK